MPFSAFGLHADILRGIKDLGFTRPTPIQAEAIPPAMAGRDVLACAMTGSGKTAAFLLPIIHHLMTKPRRVEKGRTTRVLVLTPTRELAAQIHQNLTEFAVHTHISGAPVIGGVGMAAQEHAFRMGVDFIIATPGRLLDHLKRPYANLTNLEYLVLDEADRMLDMGFLPDIRRILRVLPPKRQTLFFSATMPNEIRQLTRELLHDPASIQTERQSTPAVGITQAIYPVPQHLKAQLLTALLQGPELESVICFTRTKHRANRLAEHLKRNGISCAPIHGNRTQGQRTAALAGFKSRDYRVLVATDIAARGIDISDVSHVINFDCPHIPDDYIHRVGRTGRASATGDAFTFVSQEEESDLRNIERAINKRLPRITLPEFDYNQKPTERLEIPIAERIAAIRAEKARARSRRSPGAPAPYGQRPQGDGRAHSQGGGGGGRSQNQGQGQPPYGQQNRPAGATFIPDGLGKPPAQSGNYAGPRSDPNHRRPHLPGHGGGNNRGRR